MANAGELSIRITISNEEAKKALQSLKLEFDKLTQQVNLTREAFTQSFKNLESATPRAVQAMLQLNYAIQDLPYGLRGIANNLNMIIQSFALLKSEGLTTAQMFKVFASVLSGPLGVIMLSSILISVIQMISFGMGKAGKQAKEVSDEFEKFRRKVEDLNEELRRGINDIDSFSLKIEELRKEIGLAPDVLDRVTIALDDFRSVIAISSLGAVEFTREVQDLEKGLEAITKSATETTFSFNQFSTTTSSFKSPSQIKELDKDLQKLFMVAELNKEFKNFQAQIDAVKEATKKYRTEEGLTKALQSYPVNILQSALKDLRKEIESTSDASERSKLVQRVELLDSVIKKLTTSQKAKIDTDKEEINLLELKEKLVKNEIQRLELSYSAKIKALELDFRRGQITKAYFEEAKKLLELQKEQEKEEVVRKAISKAIEDEYKREKELAELREDEIGRLEDLKEAELTRLKNLLQAQLISESEFLIQRELIEAEFNKKILSAKERQIKEQIDLERAKAKAIQNETLRIIELRRVELNELEQLYKAGLISQEEFTVRRMEVERRYQDEIMQIRLSFLKDLTSQFSLLAKENTELAKTLAIANAIINTYEGATKALAKYPPPFSFLLASLVVATGLAYVSKIASVGFEKGGYTGAGQKKEVAGVVHKGEFVFEKDIVDKELPNLIALREELKKGKTFDDILGRRVLNVFTPTVVVNTVPKVENKIEINANFDYLKFLVKEFRKFEKYTQSKRV